jgi:hypothetical protein
LTNTRYTYDIHYIYVGLVAYVALRAENNVALARLRSWHIRWAAVDECIRDVAPRGAQFVNRTRAGIRQIDETQSLC